MVTVGAQFIAPVIPAKAGIQVFITPPLSPSYLKRGIKEDVILSEAKNLL